MKTDILIQNIIAIAILLTLFFIGFTWIIFDFTHSSSPLMDSLSIVSALFGGIATLTAAYIASKLFNDWRDQHRTQFYEKFYHELRNTVFDFQKNYLSYKRAIKKNNSIHNQEYHDQIYTLEKELLNSADSTIYLINGFLHLLNKESKSKTIKYKKHIESLDEIIQIFEKYDPNKNFDQYHAHILKNINSSCLDDRIFDLYDNLSFDLLDDLYNTTQ